MSTGAITALPTDETVVSRAAVLLLVFNRPELTARVLGAIRQARPPRLYIAADGPRPSRPTDAALCRRTREVCAQVDWECEVHHLYREGNLGCRAAVSSAIDWFFGREERGIILEDDVLPHPTFFSFCEHRLGQYESDESVMMVAGANPVAAFHHTSASHILSPYGLVWGWATWRTAWTRHDSEIRDWPEVRSHIRSLRYGGMSRTSLLMWRDILDELYHGRIDTWDFQWFLAIFRSRGFIVIPSQSLIENIGYGDEATHTHGDRPPWVDKMRVVPHDERTETQARGAVDHRFAELIERHVYLLRGSSFARYVVKGAFRRLGVPGSFFTSLSRLLK